MANPNPVVDGYDIPLVQDDGREYPAESGHRHARVWIGEIPDFTATSTRDFPQVGDIWVAGSTVKIRAVGSWVIVS